MLINFKSRICFLCDSIEFEPRWYHVQNPEKRFWLGDQIYCVLHGDTKEYVVFHSNLNKYYSCFFVAGSWRHYWDIEYYTIADFYVIDEVANARIGSFEGIIKQSVFFRHANKFQKV